MPRNIDYIRSLTAKQLAYELNMCPDSFGGDRGPEYNSCEGYTDCEKCFQDWLEEERDE